MNLSIIFSEETKTFHLSNQLVSYVIAIEEDRYLAHHYWGKRLNKVMSGADYPRRDFSHFANPHHVDHREFSLGTLLQEFPGADVGDHREYAYKYTDEKGHHANQLVYKSHEIFKGKKELEGLPHTYVTDEAQAETLEILVEDSITGMEATLSYTIFEKQPVITRSVKFKNQGKETLHLNRALSMSVDFWNANYDLLQLPGAWSREREVVRSPLVRGIHKLDSKRGTTSHTYQPFIGLLDPNTTEQAGDAYGFQFVYSGEFVGHVEVDSFSQTRIQLGINPEHFEWTLKPEDTFQTPEAVMVYSDEGLNGMSQAYHKLYQNHLIRGEHQHKERPVLINNWEGTYFDFTEDKILEMAETASELGIELFVLDDGWFGKRDDDTTSLGDWFIDRAKLPNGLKKLSEAIHDKGMQFGLWFEPEMISEESELYKKHPDWAIHTPNRPLSRGRHQLVIDFSRKEVRENILAQMKKILDEVPIDYIKWDYNRNMTELTSGEMTHRYMLGLYEVMEELVTSYPNILFESCSGGGGRYDPSMLYYMPQTWTSDNTDAAQRLEIQYGTTMTMPVSSMGAHVSAVPNHQVNRITSLKMRGDVAMSGNLGYELDTTKLTSDEKETVKAQVEFYKKHRKLIQFGDFYRILSPYEGTNQTSWIFVSEDQSEALYSFFQIMDYANKPRPRLKLTGLDPNKVYQLSDGRVLGGDELMYRGIFLETDLVGDYQSYQIYLKELSES